MNKTTLGNGLRVISIPLKESKSVTVLILVFKKTIRVN